MKKSILKSVFLIVIGAFCLSSCATIFTGTKDRIYFKSTPSGATVFKDGIELCKTPCSEKINRSLNTTDVEIKLDGYETRVITLDRSFNAVSILNLGSIIGWGIDALTGSLMKYGKKSYDVTLSKNKNLSDLKPTKINIDSKGHKVDIYVMQ